MYPVRIPVAKVTKLADLKTLSATRDGSAPDLSKEVRISHGSWKVKDQPGIGESKSREVHRGDALTQLPKLLQSDLKNRLALHLASNFVQAVLGRNAKSVSLSQIQQLQHVVELIDHLSSQHKGLTPSRATELLAYAVSDKTRLKELSMLQGVLNKAAKIMADEGQMTLAGDAYSRASAAATVDFPLDSKRAITPTDDGASVWETPSAQAESPSSPARKEGEIHWHSGAEASRRAEGHLLERKHGPTTPASPLSEVDQRRGQDHADKLARGVPFGAIGKFFTAGEKHFLLQALSQKLEKLPAFGQASEAQKTTILRIANGIDAWKKGEGSPGVALDAADYSDWPQLVLDSMARAGELDSNKL